jgi:hypothetical protein
VRVTWSQDLKALQCKDYGSRNALTYARQSPKPSDAIKTDDLRLNEVKIPLLDSICRPQAVAGPVRPAI